MSEKIVLNVRTDPLAMKEPFYISGHVFHEMPSIIVTLQEGEFSGRGEAAGVYYLGDDVERMMSDIERVRDSIENGASRLELQNLLPPCGARNALDCAMWELEANRAGKAVWQIAGLQKPKTLMTAITLSADTPERMVENGREFPGVRALKLKVTGDVDMDCRRVEAMRQAFPECWIGVDANQGYNIDELNAVAPVFQRLNVKLIEQPLPRGDEHYLNEYCGLIPLAADESVLSLAEVGALVGHFNVVNIKLDKCGGLTEGFALVKRAQALGLDVMVGNMCGSSLAMAPAYLIGQFCTVVDLDGPVTLKTDHVPSVKYIDGYIDCSEDVWGGKSLTV